MPHRTPPVLHRDVSHQIRHKPPPPLVERLAEAEEDNPVPEPVAAMILACLSKDPDQRPQTARQIAEWIGLDLGSHPVSQDRGPREETPSPAAVSNPPSAPVEPTAPPGRARRYRIGACVLAVLLPGLGLAAWHKFNPAPGNLPLFGMGKSGFRELFDGRSLDGWQILGNSEAFQVEDGVLLAGLTPRRSLLFQGDYQDLELVLEVKAHPLNRAATRYRNIRLRKLKPDETVD